MNKTVYVRDNAIWDRAAELAKKLDRSMSDVINELLGDWASSPRTLNSLTMADKNEPRNLFTENDNGHRVEYRWTGWKESQVSYTVAAQWYAVIDRNDSEKIRGLWVSAGDPPTCGRYSPGACFDVSTAPMLDGEITAYVIEKLKRLRAEALVKLREIVKQELERA